jgi:hypothetical protein
MQPLNELLKDYDKRRRVLWTDESRQAFEEMKTAIHECPALFFIEDGLPVFLHTDASKYGIGAYLFQIDAQGRERPICFISKTLSDTQRRWHTPQKEAYAIYYAFKQLEYLLRGVKFTLRTDHKNLIYINETMTEMVIRWKIAVQEYDFDIEHIPGPKNEVADNLSRLVKEVLDHATTTPVAQVLSLLCPLDPEDHNLCTFWSENEKKSVEDQNEKKYKIPAEIRQIIARSHNSFVGHHGKDRTLDKVKTILENNKTLAAQFPIDRQLSEYITQFIQMCPVCQKLSAIRVPIQAKTFTTATYEPHQMLNIDTIGPLPEDDDGYCYILVVIDTFTRWIELFAIKTVTGAEAAIMLLQHFGRFGQAQLIQSDNGSQFVNELIHELWQLIGIEHKRTLAYSSEENAIVERANKEVLRHLRAIIHDVKVIDKWRIYLPFVQRILNSSVNQNIGVSPAQLLFGNAITLNRSVLVDLPTHVKRDLSEWALDMMQAQYIALDAAATYQKSVDERNRTKRQREDPTEFSDGSLVLTKYHKTGFKTGPPNKLLTHLKGPFQVLEHDDNTYKLRELGSQKMETHHVTDLRPFYYDPDTTDPHEVSNSDRQLFTVKAITGHTGDPRMKSKMMFTVQWKGWEGHPQEFTQQPWKDVKDNVYLHQYLRDHGWAKHIPNKYQ